MTKFKLQFSDVLSSIIGLILFLLSVFPHFVPLGIIVLAITIIYGYVKKEVVFKLNLIGSLLIALYVAYGIGLLFTNFPKEAMSYMEYKLSLMVFPLLLMIQLKKALSLRIISIGLILGCFIGFNIGFGNGFSCYLKSGDFNCLLSSSVSTIIHPTYFSIYTTVAIVCIWVGYFNKWESFTLVRSLFFTIILVLYTVFMMSLMGMLFLGLLFFVAIILFFYAKWKWIGVAFFVILSPLILLASYKFIPQVTHEVDDVVYYGERYINNSDHYFESLYYPYSGTESRLIMWKISWEQLQETPMGLGTGNVDFALQQRMKNKLDDEFVERNLNSHNQYFQTGLEIGIVGIFILLAIICLAFYKAIKEKNWILLTVVVSLFFNCLFESILQRQSGVVFFTLMLVVLIVPNTFSKNE